MLVSLLIGAAAGFGARAGQSQITEFLAGLPVLGKIIRTDDGLAAALLTCLLAVTLVGGLLGLHLRPLWLMIGVVLGFYQEQIRDAVQNRDP